VTSPHVQLRRATDNPFRAECIEALPYRFEPGARDALLARFEALGHRGLLVGPHGSGKTTLLEELQRHFAARGHHVRAVTLREDHRRIESATWRTLVAGVGPGDLVTIDGVDLLSPWTRRQLRRACRPAGAVLATAHRPGFLPVLREHRTSLDMLRALAIELLPGEDLAPIEPELERLFAVQGGNVRECWRALYDAWAKNDNEELEFQLRCKPQD